MSPPINPPRTKKEKFALIHGIVAPPTARTRRTVSTLTATSPSTRTRHIQGFALPRSKTIRTNIQPARTKAEKLELLHGKQPEFKQRRTSNVTRPTRTMILPVEDDDDDEDSFMTNHPKTFADADFQSSTPPSATTFDAPTMHGGDYDDEQPQQLAVRLVVPTTITFRAAVSTSLVVLVVSLVTYKNDPVSWILAVCFATVFLERIIIATTAKLE